MKGLKRRELIIIIAAACVVLAVILIVRPGRADNTNGRDRAGASAAHVGDRRFERELRDVAERFNKSLPMQVDNVTRLDNVIAPGGREIRYSYTILVPAEELDAAYLADYLRPIVINNIKTSPDMKYLRENDTVFTYYYRDTDGVFVLSLTITPDMYAPVSPAAPATENTPQT